MAEPVEWKIVNYIPRTRKWNFQKAIDMRTSIHPQSASEEEENEELSKSFSSGLIPKQHPNNNIRRCCVIICDPIQRRLIGKPL